MKKTLFTLASLSLISAAALASPFTAGDIVVEQIGDTTTGASSSAATPVYLDEYTSSGSLVEQIEMPTADSGSVHAFTNSGTASSEGLLTLSPDGQYLALAGYDAAPGTASIASSSVSRTVGIVNAAGSVNTSTALTDTFLQGNNIRGAVTADGNKIWVSGGVGGIDYTTLGYSTSTQLNSSDNNFDGINIVGGQLYGLSQNNPVKGISTIGTGEPTTGSQTISLLSNFSLDSHGLTFFLADLNGATSPNTAYVADTSNGIEKWSLSGGNWSETNAIALSNCTGITASVSGNSVTLYVTTPGAIEKLTDSSGLGGSLTGTPSVIASIGNSSDEAFRGIAFAPVAVPEPATWGMMLGGLGSLLAYQFRRRRNTFKS
jgi:hypothetical protein